MARIHKRGLLTNLGLCASNDAFRRYDAHKPRFVNKPPLRIRANEFVTRYNMSLYRSLCYTIHFFFYIPIEIHLSFSLQVPH